MSAMKAKGHLVGVLIAMLMFMMVFPFGFVFALDTSLQTDYWDTTRYANSTPNVVVSDANAAEFISFSFNEKESAALPGIFLSFGHGLLIIIH